MVCSNVVGMTRLLEGIYAHADVFSCSLLLILPCPATLLIKNQTCRQTRLSFSENLSSCKFAIHVLLLLKYKQNEPQKTEAWLEQVLH